MQQGDQSGPRVIQCGQSLEHAQLQGMGRVSTNNLSGVEDGPDCDGHEAPLKPLIT